MKIVIVLPTFNESQNLRILLENIKKEVRTAYIIIVDDSYPKESHKIKKIASDFQHVEIITRERKLGRGSAVLDGFRHALQNKQFRYFVEMDTDLAHDPKELIQFYERIRKGGMDLVIGSRYLNASKIVDWPLRRLVMSKIINFFLNLWLGLNLHDYTNGYRMYTRRAVAYLVKTGLREKNFIALSESAYLLKKQGMRIMEIPITFTDRKHGISSVGSRELFQSLLGAFRIKLRSIIHV
ncbi:MAG TPA: glycosyltransferase [Patescibacteria group bacterium]|nr:glycosyltransferase [Patescibacteria group bacterium]